MAAFAAMTASSQTIPAQPPQQKASSLATVQLRSQIAVAAGAEQFHRVLKTQSWDLGRTAIIVCDVWDAHHCLNAVRRVGEVAPHIDALVQHLRARGATIIHAPSDCMAFYESHPARLRARNVPIRENTPSDIASWCDRILAEDGKPYPVDQSDGGEDDDLEEHAQWQETLVAMGRNPKTPWIRQTPAIAIDDQRDWISDSGVEIWNILSQLRIEHVMLCGVHTNMCVLGRPFGLRQLSQHGIHTVLVRDLTDTMYNPDRWPYVSHFSGTDRVVDHIEQNVCETVSSEQFLGGAPFRFSQDARPHWVVVMAEDEYGTEKSLTRWTQEHLSKDCRVSLVYARQENPNELLGLEALDDADALMISVRRRPLPIEQLDRIRRFIASGKPVLGIRTSSHAFALRDGAEAPGLAQWPEFDAEVFGGNYSGHHGNELVARIVGTSTLFSSPWALMEPQKDPASMVFESQGSLYRTGPLRPGTRVLLQGTVKGFPSEPVAWTFVRADSGRSFYTSLGHAADFDQPEFSALLWNAVHWLTQLPQRRSPDEMAADRLAVRAGQGKQR